MKDFKFKKWKDKFSEYTRTKGKSLYDEGEITSVNIEGNQYQVDVATDIDYTVQFEFDGDKIKKLQCNCGENHCSHMAAAMILLENQDHKYDQIFNSSKALNETYNQNIHLYLNEMSQAELIELLMDILNHDPDLRDEFFLKQKPDASHIRVKPINQNQSDLYKDLSDEEIYLKLDSRCKNLNEKLDSLNLVIEEAYNIELYGLRGYKKGEAYPDIDKIFRRLYNYNESIIEIVNLARRYLLKNDHLEDAFKIGRSLLIAITNIEDDQAYENFFGAIDSLYNYLCELIEKLSQEDRERLFAYFGKYITDGNIWSNYNLKRIYELLIKEFLTEKEKLKLDLKKLVNEDKDQRYFNLDNALMRIHLMKQLDYPSSEIEAFIKTCLVNAEYLHYEYEEALKEKNYSLALDRLLESKKVTKDKYKKEIYSRELIDLYGVLDDTRYTSELKYFLENYHYSGWPKVKEVIELLRSSLSSDAWEEYRDKILIPKLETSESLEILKEEKEFKKMLEILEANVGDISLLMMSSDVLNKVYPDEFKNLCLKTLDQKMKKARTRNAYQEIILDLRILNNFPDEMTLRDSLIKNWIEKYPKRVAMKEELLGAFK